MTLTLRLGWQLLAPFVSAGAAVDYQLYLISSGNRSRHRVDLDCRDDDHALSVIGECITDQAMELWQNQRLVKRFERTTPE